MIVRVFSDPPPLANLTIPGLSIRTFSLPRDVVRALAALHWSAGTAAVVDLNLHGLLGRDVIEYIAERHPLVGLWGITALCPKDWPAWATERCQRIFHATGTADFFRWLTEIGGDGGVCVDPSPADAAVTPSEG